MTKYLAGRHIGGVLRSKGPTSPKVSPFRPLGGGFKQNLNIKSTDIQGIPSTAVDSPTGTRKQNDESRMSSSKMKSRNSSPFDRWQDKGKDGRVERFTAAVGSGVFSIEQVNQLGAIIESTDSVGGRDITSTAGK